MLDGEEREQHTSLGIGTSPADLELPVKFKSLGHQVEQPLKRDRSLVVRPCAEVVPVVLTFRNNLKKTVIQVIVPGWQRGSFSLRGSVRQK
jgi:hypothetical protein